MSLKLRFELPKKLFIKDPQDSEFGHRLLSNAVELISELGFESFNFRKLGTKMSSSEVSIYRYFENKHLLLLYLNCWYWEWVTYLINMQVLNVKDSAEKLTKAIHCMIHASAESELSDYINEGLLFQIIMKESSKTYHISGVDEENKYGVFLPYKELVGQLASIINEINPSFSYSQSLGSSLYEMINNQLYYAEHLPRLTSLSKEKALEDLEKMVNHFAFAAINYEYSPAAT
jgi:hypothetical protein